MSDFKFNCSHCNQSLEAPDEMLGTVINCPACNGVITLQNPAPGLKITTPPPIIHANDAVEKEKKPDEQWYFSVSDQQRGPISREDVKQKVDAGEITAATLFWKEGMAAWSPAGQTVFSEYFRKTTPPPLSPPPSTVPPAISPKTPPASGRILPSGHSFLVSADSPDGAIDEKLLGTLMPDLQLTADEELFFVWKTNTAAMEFPGFIKPLYSLLVSSRRVLAIAKDKTGKINRCEFLLSKIRSATAIKGSFIMDTLELIAIDPGERSIKYDFIYAAPFKRDYFLPAIVDYIRKCSGGVDPQTSFAPPQGNSANAAASANDDAIRCPRCGSSTVEWDKTKFGMGKAFAGAILLGPLGALTGFSGKKTIIFTCLKCGNTWKPGEQR